MAEFDGVAFKATSVRFTPEAHAKFAKWARDAKMTRSAFALRLMNEGALSLKRKGVRPVDLGKDRG